MKKSIFFLLFGPFSLLSFEVANGQTPSALVMPVTSVTYANTGADTATIKPASVSNVVSLQAVVTKNSGTVAGTVLPYGTLDGVTYVQISTDTLKCTNVTTNSKVWVISPSNYVGFRLRSVGSGTMNGSLKGYYYGQKQY